MATEYCARFDWTSTARGGAQLTGGQLVGIACHWPGTSTNAYGVESKATVAARLRAWWDYHVNVRGWSDIGYGNGFDQAGRVWDLRGLSRVGAHCASPSNPDANHEWLGVLFILGDREEPTPAMVRAFQDFRHDVFLPRWPGRTRLTGHGRAPGVPGAQTDCPGLYVAAEITSGVLARQPQEDDDMTPDESRKLDRVYDLAEMYLDAGIAGKTNAILAKLDTDVLPALADTPRAVQAYKNAAFVILGDAYKMSRDALMHSEIARVLAEETSMGPITTERRDQVVVEIEAKYRPVT